MLCIFRSVPPEVKHKFKVSIMSFNDIIRTIVAFFQSIWLFIAGLFTPASVKPAEPVIIPPPENPAIISFDDFSLVWSDEFDGDTLDASKWTGFRCGSEKSVVRQGGWWNTDFASVKDGNLNITAKYYSDGYKGGKAGWYSCGLCTTGLFEQTYGYFEVRCILPKGVGMWSAFWMLPQDFSHTIGNGGTDGAEIDVFESPDYHYKLSHNVNVVSTNIHIDGYGTEEQSKCVATPFIESNDPYEEFNTYGVEWNEKEYIFYINGVETGRTDFGGTSRVPEYLLLTTEVGGKNGKASSSWAGDALSSDAHPTDFVVDYVRVYQYK